MIIDATFEVQLMLKSKETDMPSFLNPTRTTRTEDIEIPDWLQDYVPKYIEGRRTGDTPIYNADKITLERCIKMLKPVFGKETKVTKMNDDDIVDSAITHVVEDNLDERVTDRDDAVDILGIDVGKVCDDEHYLANAFVKLVKWGEHGVE